MPDRTLITETYGSVLLAPRGPAGWVTSGDQHWRRTACNPRTYAAGIRHVAFVLPETVFRPRSVPRYTANTAAADGQAIEVVDHRTIPEARQWLRQSLQGPAAG